MANRGAVTQITGPVVDVRFQEDQVPAILNALEIKAPDRTVVLEVLQHIGDNRVRCVAMEATEGLSRGLDVEDTGGPIKAPVGDEVLGRMFNVIGKVIDDKGPFTAGAYASIHRAAPPFAEQRPAS